MLNRAGRAALLFTVSVSVGSLLLQPGAAQTSPAPQAPAQLKISGAVATPLTLTVADLKAMPRTILNVTNPHEKKVEAYESVLLEELLRRAGVPHGEQLRGP